MIENFTYPKENTFTVYTKSNCIYCTKVKELLKSNKQRSIFISYRITYWEKYKTFPMVFNGNNFIGGFVDTEKYIESILQLNQNTNINFQEDF